MIDQQVTALIPTSPIPRHPDTGLIQDCVAAIRFYLPEARVVIMCDGLRPSLEHRRPRYDEYCDRLTGLSKAGNLGNCEVKRWNRHSQQAIMTRETLASVGTPIILFVEHDTILRRSPRINVEASIGAILDGQANVVRLYNWGGNEVWHEHSYLMRGEFYHRDQRFTRTVQYSQWPLFSSTIYHRWLLEKFIPKDTVTMIEPAVYGRVSSSEWTEHQIVIYGPDDSPTFEHRDGRLDAETGLRDPAGW